MAIKKAAFAKYAQLQKQAPKQKLNRLTGSIAEDKLETNLGQTGDKHRTNIGQTEDTHKTEPRTEPRTNASSSSSTIHTISTTTGLDENFSQVQIPKVLKENNFSINILKQVQDRGYLNAEDLQSSLEAFAFDITTNNILTKKKVNNAVAYFMGIVKNKTQYAAPSNFESDAEKALQEQKKRLEELKKKRLEATRIADDLAFEEWLHTLSDIKKTTISPPHGIFQLGTAVHDLELKDYYQKMIKGEVKLIK